MALSQDFYGSQKFVWWVGVVEDRFDPAKLNRVRVRIIGVDSFDTGLLPREKLPWAQMVSAVNGSKSQSLPKEGDWVFGFFQDGESAQIRTVMGYFPGIETDDIYTSQTLTPSQKNYLDAQLQKQIENAEAGTVTNADTSTTVIVTENSQGPYTSAQLASTAAADGDVVLVIDYRKEDYPEYSDFLAKEKIKYPDDTAKAEQYADAALKESVRAGTVSPRGATKVTLGSSWGLNLNTKQYAYNYQYRVRVPKYAKTPTSDEPTGSRLARGILANTGIEFMNDRLMHVCPSDLEIRQRIGANKYVRQVLIKVSRAIAKAINALLGADPSGRIAYWTKKVQQINTFIQDLLEVVEKIKDFVKLVVTTVQLARLIVDWIRNLPDRFRRVLKECLERILNIIKSYLVEFIQEELAGQLGGADAMNQVLADVKDLTNEIDELEQGLDQIQFAGEYLQSLEGLPDYLQTIATTETYGDIESIEAAAIQLGNVYDSMFDESEQRSATTVSPEWGY
jgi:hypothetical protein